MDSLLKQPTIEIAYEGAEAQRHAVRLREVLYSEIPISEIKDDTPAGGELGVGEVIVTFVVTGLAKSFASVLLGRIRAFLKERIEQKDRGLRLRIDLNREGVVTNRIPFSLERATLETADRFCGQIEKAIGAF